jgi:hypothetical protein
VDRAEISKQNAKGMIVFPGELRMYHQRHLTWRKTLRKVIVHEEQTLNRRDRVMITNLRTIENCSAPAIQGRTSNSKRKGAWRQYAILVMTLATASVQGEVIVNNLNQPVSAWDGPIGTNANTNGFLLAQQITLPAANYASYIINKVTLRLRPNGASPSITVSIWDVDPPSNNPGSQIAVVASRTVTTLTNVDFISATNIVLAPGMYYVVATPTTPADNAKVSWAYTGAWTNWSGTGILDSFASTANGSWANLPVYQSPFLLSLEATPTIGAVAMSLQGGVTSLSWPASLTGFVVESTTNVAPSNWQIITNQPIQIGNQIVISNSWTDSERFFRLRQPFAADNLDQWPGPWDGPIGNDANGNDSLLGQVFTLPAGNYAIDKVTLLLNPVNGSGHITVSIWHVGLNNLPTTQISAVSSQLVASAGEVDFIPSAPITLSGGSYYVVAAPTTAADNAKVGWVYTFSTFWKGLGTLGGTADKFPGYWEYSSIGYGPFQLSIRATPK